MIRCYCASLVEEEMMLLFALANKDSDEDDEVGDALARMDVAELGRASLLAS